MGNCSPVHGPTVPSLTSSASSLSSSSTIAVSSTVPELDLGPAMLDLPVVSSKLKSDLRVDTRVSDVMDVNITPPLRFVYYDFSKGIFVPKPTVSDLNLIVIKLARSIIN